MINKEQIFVCDDDLSILEVLKVVLETTGMDVQTESKSSKLIERLKECHPAMLIIDLWMPELPGDEIIRYLRSKTEFDELYILCISASIEGKQVSLQAGADAFLAKPFDISDIISFANQALVK